jgi:HlyD family secretion protein
MSANSPSPFRRRQSDVGESFSRHRSEAGRDVGDTRDTLHSLVDDARYTGDLMQEVERDLALLQLTATAKVVPVTEIYSQPQPSNRRWTGVALVAVVLLSSWALSSADDRTVLSANGEASVVEGTLFTGTIRPSERVTVNAPFGGTVRRLLVDVGDKVAAGQPLLEVDDQEARAALDAALLDQQAAVTEAAQWQRSIATLDQSVADLSATFAQSVGTLAVAQRQAEQVPGRQLRDSPERAQAALDQAKAKLARLQKLHAQGIVSDEELEDQSIAVRIAENDLENASQWRAAAAQLARAQEDQARLQTARSRADHKQLRDDYVVRLAQARGRAEQAGQRVNAARRMLENAVVRAITPGVVADVSVVVGDRPAAGTPVMVVANLDELLVDVPVASTLVNILRPGQEATVVLPTLPQQRVTGRITSINPIPAANMTHTIEVQFTNTSGALLSGQPAEVAFR